MQGITHCTAMFCTAPYCTVLLTLYSFIVGSGDLGYGAWFIPHLQYYWVVSSMDLLCAQSRAYGVVISAAGRASHTEQAVKAHYSYPTLCICIYVAYCRLVVIVKPTYSA